LITQYSSNGKYEGDVFKLNDHINNNNRVIIQRNLNGDIIKEWGNVKLIITKLKMSKYAPKQIYKVCNGEINYYLNF